MLNRIPNTELPELPTFDPAELISLAELASEGLGWSIQATTPRAAIGALAERLTGEVILDDIGRRCVTRETARRLLAERDQAEERQRQAQAARRGSRPRRRPSGVRVELPDGTLPVSAMLQAAQDAEPRRTSVLEDALAGGRQLRRSLRRRDAS